MRFALAVAGALGSLLVVACGPSGGGSGCKDKILAGDLVITEVFPDYAAPAGSSGADAGKEWFEVYNASDHPIDLKGLTLVSSRPDGSKSNSHDMTSIVISPGQFMVMGNTTADLLPPYIDYGYSSDLGELFNTDGGKLALKCSDSEIDSAAYDGVKSGHSRELSSAVPPDFTANDDLANWCQADATEFDPGNFGTPGQDNDCTPVVVGQCNDNGTMRAVVTPAVGDLVITEVMPQPTGDDAVTEWFELKVNTDVDLNGLGVSRVSSTSGAGTIDSPDCVHVTAGSYVVLAKNADMTMNLLPTGVVVGTFKSTLSLVNGSATTPGDLEITEGSTVLDAVSWTHSSAGKSIQVDPDFETADGNDDPSVFCDAQKQYYTDGGTNTDYGTPGLENDQCTILPPDGMCNDGGTIRAIVPPAAGQLVITEALNNSTVANEWFEVYNSGAAAFDLNGLQVQSLTATTTFYPLAATDCKSIAPGAYGLMAHSLDPTANGGLDGVDVTYSTSLNLSTGLKVYLADKTTLIDSAKWINTSTAGTATKELGTAHLNATDNDTVTNWCNATTAYGTAGLTGTPKAANDCTP